MIRRSLVFLASLRREAARRARAAAARSWIAVARREAELIRAQRCWLVGAASGAMYSDNGAALHQYLRASHSDISVFWVIDRDSPDVSRARSIGPVLFRDDWRTVARALLAEVIVISHGVHDVPGAAVPQCGAFRVRLGHGITALKRTKPRILHTTESANAVFDLVPVSSTLEREIKRSWGIPPERLVVTGVPRFDTLVAKQRARPADPRLILYLPTWRDEVAAGSAAAQATFFRGLDAFLDSPALHSLLERHDARVVVALHPNLRTAARRWAKQGRNARVRIEAELSDPQDLLVEAGALVTDYSSVTWDFLYVDKPVLFYQFDRERFDDARGGYVDAGWNLPGPVADTAPALLANLERYLTGQLGADVELRDAVESWKADVFEFRDAGACERIVGEILRRLSHPTHGD